MTSHHFALAALAAAAVPGLAPTGVAESPDDPREFESVVVFDDRRQRWRVRRPLTQEAAMRLETELQVLAGFTPSVKAGLPFRTPAVAGAVRQDELRTFVYQDMPGAVLPLDDLVAAGERTAQDVARAMASIHGLDEQVVRGADLPAYTADEVRTRRLNELDQAATTGRIPPVLLRRWEAALEEERLWGFEPVPVHGDLHEDNLLFERGRLVGVIGWTDLHIGDPAEDLAWLASVDEPAFADLVLTAYRERVGGGDDADPHLMRRATLVAEFALAQWLVRGVDRKDPEMIAEAEQMLAELAEAVQAAESPRPAPVRTEAPAPAAGAEPSGADRAAADDDSPGPASA